MYFEKINALFLNFTYPTFALLCWQFPFGDFVFIARTTTALNKSVAAEWVQQCIPHP